MLLWHWDFHKPIRTFHHLLIKYPNTIREKSAGQRNKLLFFVVSNSPGRFRDKSYSYYFAQHWPSYDIELIAFILLSLLIYREGTDLLFHLIWRQVSCKLFEIVEIWDATETMCVQKWNNSDNWRPLHRNKWSALEIYGYNDFKQLTLTE